MYSLNVLDTEDHREKYLLLNEYSNMVAFNLIGIESVSMISILSEIFSVILNIPSSVIVQYC